MKFGDRPRLLLDSLLLGVIGGLAAQLFMWMLRLSQHFFLFWLAGYRPPGLPQEGGILQEAVGAHGLWLVPLVTTLGGLISGALVYGLAPETEGHGTDTVVKCCVRVWRR
jgi:chloride channel protein, CIC family